MRLLYIIPSLQHPTMRGPTRHYHFIRELSKRHAITLLAPVKSESDIPSQALQEISSHLERLLLFPIDGPHRRLAGRAIAGVPLVGRRLEQMRGFRSVLARMERAFRELAQDESYDAVIFHGKPLYSIIKGWKGVPLVVDFCDATSMRIRARMRCAHWAWRPFVALRYLQMRSVERQILTQTPHVGFISPRDRAAILGPDSRCEILPNGVDLSYWTRKATEPARNCIVFTGVMDYPPNDDAARHLMEKVLPLVRRHVSPLEVLVVGRSPTDALLREARKHPDVTVTGFVEDVRPYLERAAVFAAPIRFGAGMQNKVLEAMAMQVPVVASPLAADGLCTEDGDQPPMYIADAAEEFARRLVELLQSEQERTRLAAEGRRFMERNFDWARTAGKLESMCMRGLERSLDPARTQLA